jgi:hypothetical protein
MSNKNAMPPGAWVGAACLLGLFALLVWALHHDLQQNPVPHLAVPPGSDLTLLDKITNDPVAFTTLCLVGVTALLAISSIGLWIVTRNGILRQKIDMQNLERAYLFLANELRDEIVPFNLQALMRREADTRSYVYFRYKNHGKTPAIIEERHDRVSYWDADSKPDMNFTVGGSIPRGFVVSGGEETHELSIGMPIDAEEIAKAEAGEGQILFWGKVVYRDIFGDRHETGFCRYYRFEEKCFRFIEAEELNYHT